MAFKHLFYRNAEKRAQLKSATKDIILTVEQFVRRKRSIMASKLKTGTIV